MLDFLSNRDNRKGYVRKIIKSIEKYAEFWNDNKIEIMNQTAAILVCKLEKGMPSKEYEQGYRDGLASLTQLWAGALAESQIEKRNSLKK
jgi:hypothetical protein